MSVNTARMLNIIFSSPAWKLLLVLGIPALIACFFIKGKKRTIPVIICIVSVCLYIVTAGLRGYADHLISQQAGQDPLKISDSGDENVIRGIDMDIADGMTTTPVDDKEFVVIRIKDEYYDIRRRDEYLRLHRVYTVRTDYPEIAEGNCARVVADVDIVLGGIAGYNDDYFIKNVKSCVPLTYDEVDAEFDLADAGEVNIDMYNHLLIYHDAGSSYLVCIYRDKTVVYKDGVFFAEYDDESTEGSETFEPFITDTGAGVTDDREETEDREDTDDWKETGSYYKEPDIEDIIYDESTGDRYVKNQLLIGVIHDTDESVIENLAESYDADIVGYLTKMKMYQIEFRRDVSYIELEKIAENLESCPYVSYAMLNYLDDLDN